MTRSRDIADQQENLGGAVAPFVAGKNGVINGGFDVWQRGTSISNFGFFTLYTADRWAFLSTNTGRTISRQATGDTTNLPFIQYCARVQRDSGNTDTTYLQLSQSFETVNTIPFAGKTVTYSFYARKGANFSATSNILIGRVTTGTGTDQSVITGYTGGVETDTNFTITSTWQRFSVTLTVPTTATEIATSFRYTPTGTAGAADYFEVTGVQVEIGSAATPFARAGGSIGGELALCQRYYVRNTGGDAYSHIGQGIANATNQAYIEMKLPVQMRVVPTSIDYSTVVLYDGVSLISTGLVLALLSQQSGVQVGSINASGITGLTQYRPYFIINNASASGYVGFSAEL